MKKVYFLLIAMCVLSFSTFAQTENNDTEIKTIFKNNGAISSGGYGGLMANYSRILDQDALLVGAKGAWIINHNLGLGIAGYGLMTKSNTDNIANAANGYAGLNYEYGGGYGGLLIEPILFGKNPIHLSFPIIVGAGGLAYFTNAYDGEADQNPYFEDSNAFFVVEPGVELELNVIRYFRVALLASYRYTSDISLSYTGLGIKEEDKGKTIGRSDMLRGFNFGIAFKFGKF